jgi:hypothetical protein
MLLQLVYTDVIKFTKVAVDSSALEIPLGYKKIAFIETYGKKVINF